MRNNTENSRDAVNRFLSDLGEPISSEQAERASADVRERLQMENWRTSARIAVLVPASRPKSLQTWVPFAAAAALLLAAGLLHMALLPRAQSDIVANSVRGDLAFAAVDGTSFVTSTKIDAGRVVHAGERGGTIGLLDGSEVEMAPQAELSVVRVSEGLRIRLTSGAVMVTAAKQREGHHLYVETKDCLISVIGTVFAVNAEETGSQISVIEGEVHVQRGEISQTLSAGQQASTSPELGPLAQRVGDAWLATASTRLALLQQPVIPPPQPPAEPAPPPPAQNENVIRGVVRNGGSGEVIPDATVMLCANPGTRITVAPTNAPGPPVGGQQGAGPAIGNKAFFFARWDAAAAECADETVKTDSSGRFEFGNVKPADYVVTARREGYIADANLYGQPGIFRYFAGWNAANGNAVNQWNRGAVAYVVNQKYADARVLFGVQSARSSATVDARQPVPEITLALFAGTTVSGHVRDADSKPVQNAVVRIVSRLPGTTSDGPTVSTVLTNPLGEYRVLGLAPGDYRVAASLANGLPGAETWFPSQVTVKQGDDIPNIDIVLPGR